MDQLEHNLAHFRKNSDPVLLWSPSSVEGRDVVGGVVLDDHLQHSSFRAHVEMRTTPSGRMWTTPVEPKCGWQDIDSPTEDDLRKLTSLAQKLKGVPQLTVFVRDDLPTPRNDYPLLCVAAKVPIHPHRKSWMISISDKRAFTDDIQPMFRSIKKSGKDIGSLDIKSTLGTFYGLVVDDKEYCPLMDMFNICVKNGAPSGTSFWFFNKKNRNNYLAYLNRESHSSS